MKYDIWCASNGYLLGITKSKKITYYVFKFSERLRMLALLEERMSKEENAKIPSKN